MTFETVRQLALALPGVEEKTSYRTIGFKVNGKLLARFHQDGESLVLKVEYAVREVLMGANPRPSSSRITIAVGRGCSCGSQMSIEVYCKV